MEKKRILYDFCPRCSGLMKDGVCTACGYEKAAAQQEETAYTIAAPGGSAEHTAAPGVPAGHMAASGGSARHPAAPGNPAEHPVSSGGSAEHTAVPGVPAGHTASPDDPAGYSAAQQGGTGTEHRAPDGIWGGQTPQNRTVTDLQTPEQKKHTGFIIGVCVGALIFALVLGAAIYLIVRDMKDHSAKTWNPLQEAVEEEKPVMDGEVKDYVPDPSDEYYVELADALRDDLSYQVEWQEYDVESEDKASSYYALYPVLTGDFPNIEEMNQAIGDAARREEAYCQYAAEDENIDTCHIYKEAYVTYMDEDVISIAFLEYIYLNGFALPGISDINIDARTGSVLEHESMVDYSTALAQKVRTQNLYQNSVDIEDFGWSDADIVTLLQSETGVAFYTPVGLEVGFNYSSTEGGFGWLTVTVKDYAQYQKKW